ncbi:imidazoleglycerol-phosphate dehydratase HisB [uncultured Methanoregula sp.]|uniref:imidazoleglycerol-phosphate dehydratase HisB n=1 Tax=uncultured Methanoregula sp. TaxID=1005933 RepID=UPI002AAB83A9|nr:imidazoleglycerol-phosphate dehydratase HisB [uncultured Methanoregula sp.]
MRMVEVRRETKETTIAIRLDPDGAGKVMADSGVPFFDHMLNAMARHGGFDMTLAAKGDLHVDCHHTVEDIGIVLGDAIKQAIGEGKGMKRFSHAIIPMDESLAQVTLDCGGRSYLVWTGSFGNKAVGGIPSDLFEHFFYSLCTRAGITAHISFSGRNDHHKCEAVFKAFGIALGEALSITGDKKTVRSTKGKF